MEKGLEEIFLLAKNRSDPVLFLGLHNYHYHFTLSVDRVITPIMLFHIHVCLNDPLPKSHIPFKNNTGAKTVSSIPALCTWNCLFSFLSNKEVWHFAEKKNIQLCRFLARVKINSGPTLLWIDVFLWWLKNLTNWKTEGLTEVACGTEEAAMLLLLPNS